MSEYFKMLKDLSAYYKSVEKLIIDEAKASNNKRYYNIYPCDWWQVFTPIELDAWQVIRNRSYCVMYPQYPVLNYHIDFANPYTKVGLEVDGKDYHNKERDAIRDQKLWESGWRIFRITGSEIYKTIEDPSYEMNMCQLDEEQYATYKEWVLGCGEGLIESIRQFYFLPKEMKNYRLMHLYEECLDNHRLVNFHLHVESGNCVEPDLLPF